MITKKTWKEFKDAKLLWWINRILHTFGWAIVFVVEENGDISDVYPARVTFRGFGEKSESDGFVGLTKYIKDHSDEFLQDLDEE